MDSDRQQKKRNHQPLKDKFLMFSRREAYNSGRPTNSRRLLRIRSACMVVACVCFIVITMGCNWERPRSKTSSVIYPEKMSSSMNSVKEDTELQISQRPDSQPSLYIQDAVVFPDNVMLLVKVCDSLVDLQSHRDNLECKFGGMKSNQSTTPVISVKPRTADIQVVRCARPDWVEKFPSKSHKNVTIGIHGSDLKIISNAVYRPSLPTWNFVVYESLLDGDSLVLLVKGLVTKSSRKIDVASLMCVFQTNTSSDRVAETPVLSAAQEIVRCKKPPPHLEEELRGHRLTVYADWLGVLPSVTYYDPQSTPGVILESAMSQSSPKILPLVEPELDRHQAANSIVQGLEEKISSTLDLDTEYSVFPSVAAVPDKTSFNSAHASFTGRRRPIHKLCACTMVWNKAPFIKEWVTYHSYFGVERYFVYDNDSEDDTEEVLNSLYAHNISRLAWPWIKTQQAAFSHCTILAREECEWVMFSDVDEFIFPMYYLGKSNQSDDARVFHRVIDSESDKMTISTDSSLLLGQIQFDCNNFGPSGLNHTPEQGVTVGYTCRLDKVERHKSIVRLDAVANNLLNVLHHFELRDSYASAKLPRNVAAVNHYKFQAWDAFKLKFVRRAGTYTTDWKQERNTGSKDRTPGLGTEAVKPDDWEARFCEVVDTQLRDYALRAFASSDDPNKLQWQS